MSTKYIVGYPYIINGKDKVVFTGTYGYNGNVIGFKFKNDNTYHGFSLDDDGIAYFTNNNPYINIKLDTIELRRQKLKTFIDKCS